MLEIELIIGLVVAGACISTIAMAIGIGGGILWTPLLILVYDLPPAEAVATSLIIQVIGLASGSFAYLREGLVITRLSFVFFLAALPAVLLGSFFTISLQQDQVQLALGIMAMVLGVLFVSNQENSSTISNDVIPTIKDARSLIPIPAFTGLIMGFLSVGIGEWIIPALKNRLGLSMNRAVGTVVLMMFLLVLSASTVHGLYSDNIHWQHFIWGAAGTVVGGQLGVYFAKKIPERLLKEAFIYLMTLIGIHLIFQSI